MVYWWLVPSSMVCGVFTLLLPNLRVNSISLTPILNRLLLGYFRSGIHAWDMWISALSTKWVLKNALQVYQIFLRMTHFFVLAMHMVNIIVEFFLWMLRVSVSWSQFYFSIVIYPDPFKWFLMVDILISSCLQMIIAASVLFFSWLIVPKFSISL